MKSLFFFLALYILVKPTLPVLDFVINYQYIKTELCENRDHPEMHCNGKCYLMKELAHASKHESPISETPKSHFPSFETFFEEIPRFVFAFEFYEIKKQNYDHYLNLYTNPEGSKFLHPPTLLS